MTAGAKAEAPTASAATAAPSPSRQQLCKAAIKLPLYTVPVTPIWVGSAMAAYTTG